MSPGRNIALVISCCDQNLPAIFLEGTLRTTEPNTFSKKNDLPLRKVLAKHRGGKETLLKI